LDCGKTKYITKENNYLLSLDEENQDQTSLINKIVFSEHSILKNSIAKEQEENYRLSPSDLAYLSRYPHALDFQLTEDQLMFLEENGYLVIPVS